MEAMNSSECQSRGMAISCYSAEYNTKMRNTDTSEEVPDFLYGKQSICMTKAIRKYEIMDVRGKKTKLQFL